MFVKDERNKWAMLFGGVDKKVDQQYVIILNFMTFLEISPLLQILNPLQINHQTHASVVHLTILTTMTMILLKVPAMK